MYREKDFNSDVNAIKNRLKDDQKTFKFYYEALFETSMAGKLEVAEMDDEASFIDTLVNIATPSGFIDQILPTVQRAFMYRQRAVILTDGLTTTQYEALPKLQKTIKTATEKAMQDYADQDYKNLKAYYQRDKGLKQLDREK